MFVSKMLRFTKIILEIRLLIRILLINMGRIKKGKGKEVGNY